MEINLKIHWTFILLLVWIVAIEIERGSSPTRVFFTLGFVLTVFICMILHEFGHAFAARRFGIRTDKIILFPFGGATYFEKMPEKPVQELLIVLSGTAVNAMIVGILLLILPLRDLFEIVPEQLFESKTAEAFFFLLLLFNSILILFNLIPAFPMDGGQIVRALLSLRMPREKANRVSVRLGQIFAVLFIFTGFLFDFSLSLIGAFILLSANSESKIRQGEEYLKNLKVKDVINEVFPTLSPEDSLTDVVEKMKSNRQENFLVLSDNHAVGIVTLPGLLQGLKANGQNARVKAAMETNFRTLDPEETLDAVLSRMHSGKQLIFPVVSEGKLEGIVDSVYLNNFVAIHSTIKRV